MFRGRVALPLPLQTQLPHPLASTAPCCRSDKGSRPALRLAAPYAARLVVEEGADGEPAAVVHHAMANSRLAHAEFPPGVANGGAGHIACCFLPGRGHIS